MNRSARHMRVVVVRLLAMLAAVCAIVGIRVRLVPMRTQGRNSPWPAPQTTKATSMAAESISSE